MVARKKAAKVKKVPTIYTEDGLVFKSKSMLIYYQELKELKKKKIISNFDVPSKKEQTAEMRTSKFRAVKIMIDDHVFPSILESKFYVFLKKNIKGLSIKSFEIQVTFELQEKFKKYGKSIRAITYTPDFKLTYNNGDVIYIDTKGKVTEEFKIKQKLFDFKFPQDTLLCINYDEKEKIWYDISAKKKHDIFAAA